MLQRIALFPDSFTTGCPSDTRRPLPRWLHSSALNSQRPHTITPARRSSQPSTSAHQATLRLLLARPPVPETLKLTSFRLTPGLVSSCRSTLLAKHSHSTSGYFSHSLLYTSAHRRPASLWQHRSPLAPVRRRIEWPALLSPCAASPFPPAVSLLLSHQPPPQIPGAHPRAHHGSMSTAATANSSSNALNPAASTPGRQPKMSTTAKVLDAQRKPGSPVDAGQR